MEHHELENFLLHLYDKHVIKNDRILMRDFLKFYSKSLLKIKEIGEFLYQKNYITEKPGKVLKFNTVKLDNLSYYVEMQVGQSFTCDFLWFNSMDKIRFDNKSAKKHIEGELLFDPKWSYVLLSLTNISSGNVIIAEARLMYQTIDQLDKLIGIQTWRIQRQQGIKVPLLYSNLEELNTDESFNLVLKLKVNSQEVEEKHHLKIKDIIAADTQKSRRSISEKRTRLRSDSRNNKIGRKEQMPSTLLERALFKKMILGEDLNLEELSPSALLIRNQINDFLDSKMLTPENYVEILSILSSMEEVNEDLVYNSGTLTGKSVLQGRLENRLCYFVNYSDPRELPDKIAERDLILVTDDGFEPTTNKKEDKDQGIACAVKQIDDNKLWFYTIERFKKSPFLASSQYSIRFNRDQPTYTMEQEALQRLNEDFINQILFPEIPPPLKTFKKFEDFTLFNRSLNPEQIDAAKHILAKSSVPAPYIVFGPPGTGKTSTLVEAIAQIVKQKPNENILVCASSNYACDEIAIRLLRYVSTDDVYRLYSRSSERKIDLIHDELIAVSNLIGRSFESPGTKELSSYRVVFSTLITSGRIIDAKLPKGHFSYIFIDECGSSTEVQALIPISGLLSFGKTQLVIAGDPKQLGPIIGCRFAENLGFGMSLLERLMERDVYKSKNRLMTMKLVRNYRCHPAILKLPNDLFYDGDLLAEGSPETTDFALMWPHLANKKFPILFHAVKGRTRNENNSFSLYNDLEVDTVVSYLRRLLGEKVNGRSLEQKEIGVISPYRKQCLRIRDALNRFGWKEVEVGSVEQFQGQERSVIIISTVRSNTPTVGFLNNPKRLNVSLTRAKALLIVVGNPETLKMDPNWRRFIEFCKTNGACTGCEFEATIDPSLKLKVYLRMPIGCGMGSLMNSMNHFDI